jgi:ubiquinone/menaquinone biosynthesis C-methylase UbiE
MLSWTGERYLPWWTDPVTAYEHWHRYAYAAQFVSGKNVLDLASGEGYGSATLAATARQVIALDIDENAVRHACQKYPSANLHFIVGSVMEMPHFKIGFDVIVCFEAIEHIPDPEKLLKGVKRLLVPGGVFLVSTPNKPEYKRTEPSNPFHVHELDFDEFRAMLSKHFKQTQFLGQRVYCNSSLWTIAHQTPGMISEYLLDQDKNEFVLAGVDKRVPLYFIGIASDAIGLPSATGSVLVDSSNSLLKEAARIHDETAADAQSLKEALTWRENQLRQTQEALQEQEQALAWKENQLQQVQTALEWKEDELQQAQDSLRSQEQAFAWKEDQLQQVQTALEWKEDALQQTQAALRSQKQALAWKEDQLQQAQIALAWKEDALQQIQAALRSQEQALAWKEDQLKQVQIALAWKEDELQQTRAALRSQEQALAWKEDQLQQFQAASRSQEQALAWKENQLQQAQAAIHSNEQALAWRESQVNEFTSRIHTLQAENERSAAELFVIKSGHTWRFIQKILRIRNRAFPSGSRRRAFYDRWTRS